MSLRKFRRMGEPLSMADQFNRTERRIVVVLVSAAVVLIIFGAFILS